MRGILSAGESSGPSVAPAGLRMATAAIPQRSTRQGAPGKEKQALARAFASFAEAAAALEHSYSQLQAEVIRLRHELEDTNRDLRSSLAENQRMRQHLALILETLPCGVALLQADGAISLFNPESERILGVKRGGPVPAWVGDWLSDGPECEHPGGGGAAEWVAIRRVRLGAEKSGDWLVILQDISARKRLEREREQLQRRETLAEISGLLAHEIRNPLGSLELFTGLLAEGPLGPAEHGWVEQIQTGLRSLSATVNNVLHIYSAPPSHAVSTDVGELLEAVAQLLLPLVHRAGVCLSVISEGWSGVAVAADRYRLQQVLLNLSLNALAAMTKGGQLRIAAERVAEVPRVRIVVQDTGCGISAENLKRIFDPGFSTRPGSPGLGLAVSKTIVEQHGGRIRVSSQFGRGTTFQLELPMPGDCS